MSSPAYEVMREEKPQADESPGKLRRFNMVARDFDWAICSARLSGLETLLVHRARVASWTKATMRKGKGEPIAFRLDLKALAAEVGCERARLSNAQGRLLKMGIFRRRPDGLYAIEKDFRKWVQPDCRAALLNPKTIELARLQNIPEESSACALNGTQRDSEPVPQRAHACAEKGTQPCPKQHTAVPQRAHGHIEPARVGDLETKETVGETPLPPSQVAPLPQGPNSSPPLSSPAAAPPPDETTALSCPAVPTVNGLWTLQPGKYQPGPEIVAELFALAWTLFPGRNIAYEVWERQRWYEPPVWAAALREAKRTKPNLDRVNYIEKIAAKYAEQGLPKSSEGPSAGSGLLAPPKIINRTPDDEFVVFPKDDRPRRYVPPGSRKPRTEAEIREYFRKRAQQPNGEVAQTQNLGRAGA